MFFFLPTPITYPLPTPIFFCYLPQIVDYLPQLDFFTYPKTSITYPNRVFFHHVRYPKMSITYPKSITYPHYLPQSFFLATPKCRLPTPIMKFHSLFKTKLVLLSYDLDVSALPGIVRCEERGEIE